LEDDMTVEEAIKRLRELSAAAKRGESVGAELAACEQTLATHGVRVERQRQQQHASVGAANPAIEAVAQQVAQRAMELAGGGSRFSGSAYVGPGTDLDVARQQAEGRSALGGYRVAEREGQPKAGGLASALMSAKAMAESTPSAGGYVVPIEISQEIAELVRAQVAVMTMGPTIVHVAKELDLPYISTGSAAYYVAENARIPVSEPTLTLIPKLKPIELAALVPVSDRLLRDALTNPVFEDVIRNDMAATLSGRQDLAFLQGLGGGNEPLGVRNQDGLTPAPDLGPDGGSPDLNDFRQMIGRVRSVNARFQRPGWIFHPDVLTYLESLTDSTGRPLLESENLLTVDATGGGGTFLGYRFSTTSRIPTTLTMGTSADCTYAIFGSDWQEAWVGLNLDLVLETSNDATYSTDGGTTHISAWQQRQTVFRALAAHDFALRRPEYFTVMEGIRL
jgi:HK97 family phage major capsid protein